MKRVFLRLLALLLFPVCAHAQAGSYPISINGNNVTLYNEVSSVSSAISIHNQSTGGSVQLKSDNISLDGAVSFADGTLAVPSDLTITVDSDAQRVFTFGAAGDDDVYLTALVSGTSFGSFSIHPTSVDGSDEQVLYFCGGGGPGIACALSGRGAWAALQGKEYGGSFSFSTSDSAGADATFSVSDDFIIETVAGTDKFTFDVTSGSLTVASGGITITTGGNFNTANAANGFQYTLSTVAAAGSVQGDAAAINGTYTRVTGADGTKGVVINATPSVGLVLYIANDSSSALKIYPGSGDQINNAGANTAVSVAANTLTICAPITTALWWCNEGTA